METELTAMFEEDEVVVRKKDNIKQEEVKDLIEIVELDKDDSNKEDLYTEEILAEHVRDKRVDMTTEHNINTISECDNNDEILNSDISKVLEYVTNNVVDIKEIDNKINLLTTSLKDVQNSIIKISGYEKTIDFLKNALSMCKMSEESMATELESYRKDAYFTNIRPLLMIMVGFHTEIEKSKNQYVNDKEAVVESYGDGGFKEIVDLHDFFLNYLEEQMVIQGITIRQYEIGSDFISNEQTIVKVILTSDLEMVGKIAATDDKCYIYDNRVLKKAKVQAYKLGDCK